jgi:phage regulator Rha-like protein
MDGRGKQDRSEAQRRRMYEKLASDGELDGVDLRVFLYLSSRLNFDSPVHVPQMEIAKALGKQKTHISRSIKNLKAKKIIEEDDPRSSAWQLNRDYGK